MNCDLAKNRIYGSIDLSCPLGPEREKVSDGLTAVRLLKEKNGEEKILVNGSFKMPSEKRKI